jgi:hypothetical protein
VAQRVNQKIMVLYLIVVDSVFGLEIVSELALERDFVGFKN